MDDLEPLTDAERKLLEAVQNSELCDLSQGDETDRTVRAAVLKAILSGEGEAWGIGAGAEINLRGLVVSGDLGGFDESQLPSIRLESCRFEDSVDFNGATFTGDAWFHRAIFTGDARFVEATFARDAEFGEATFTGDAEFYGTTFTGDAEFYGATFHRDAWFPGATFARDARFVEATIDRDARFVEATFTGDAEFAAATFARDAWFPGATFHRDAEFRGAIFTRGSEFGEATFTGKAEFDNSIFTGKAHFGEATFDRDASFGEATFTGDASFDGATFTGTAGFDGALAKRLSFSDALFSAADPGPWIASTISLQRTILAVRSRVSITATEIEASRLQAREGAHLVLHCPRVDLSDSEFLRRSIVSSPPAAEQIPPGTEIITGQEARAAAAAEASSPAVAEQIPPHLAIMPSQAYSPRMEARSAAAADAKKFRDDLERELAGIPPRCRLTSLARANIGELVLSDVVLNDCKFAGAHGLDKLRIGARCSFHKTPGWWKRDRLAGWRMVRRSVIAEELQWRAAHTRHRDKTTDRGPSALGIAVIYRDLRKGLEDAKNEPGAADFYYGEMEMRRLAGCKPTEAGREPTDAASKNLGPSWAERILLYGYWAFSGYGLRALRALLTLIIVLLAAAWLYTHSDFATATQSQAQIAKVDLTTGRVSYTPAGPAPKFPAALEFSARESISLLQGRTTQQPITTKGVGTVVDFVLRLAGPVLLALAILALRARIKR